MIAFLTGALVGAGLVLFGAAVALGTYGWLEMIFGDNDLDK